MANQYIDWEYYNSYFPKLSQEDFNLLVSRAERKIDIFTHMRAKTFFDDYESLTATNHQSMVYNQIKDAVCLVINRLYDNSRIRAGLTSVSNDGYSESYQATSETDLELELRSVCFNALSGTGLMGGI